MKRVCATKGYTLVNQRKEKSWLGAQETISQDENLPLASEKDVFLGPSPTGTQKPRSIVLADVNTHLAFMRQEVVSGHTLTTSKVHPQIRHISIGLKKRRFLCSNLNSEATEKWLTGGLACRFKLWSDKPEFSTDTGLALYYWLHTAMVFVQPEPHLAPSCSLGSLQLFWLYSLDMYPRTCTYSPLSQNIALKKKKKSETCLPVSCSKEALKPQGGSVWKTVRFFPPMPLLHQEVYIHYRPSSSSSNISGSAYISPLVIYDPFPHFKIVKLLDPLTPFSSLSINPRCTYDALFS